MKEKRCCPPPAICYSLQRLRQRDSARNTYSTGNTRWCLSKAAEICLVVGGGQATSGQRAAGSSVVL